uniref:28S ribosomal protein S27, mitochondrial n=1 Tax=Dendroctonus ponderosae TaxID=77166 RepID=J3JWX2_DENPD|nr:unknown [Dendroctonus ponderosae]
MFKILQILPKRPILKLFEPNCSHNVRTILSQAYYCEDVWNQRLSNPVLQKVNLDDLFYELDQRFNKTKQLNAIDIDVFANAIRDDSLCDELLDVVHKLRITADTCNTLESTSHAVVRVLLQSGKAEELINALDDRLNYGLFLDDYTANLLMDTFWKSKEYTHGARVASQLMLQEEVEHPLFCSFALLHCYNYLLNPTGWPEYAPPPEPEEEVKIRVKYLRNLYGDEHFDLRDGKKIVGKTLAIISKGKNDPLHQSFYVLGLALFGKPDLLRSFTSEVTKPLYKEVFALIPEESNVGEIINQLQTESIDLSNVLIENVKTAAQQTLESDITQQCDTFKKWESDRIQQLEAQKERLKTAKRLQSIEDINKALKEKEERLWFFENEETIDLAIESKVKYYPTRWFGPRRKPKEADASYVPPEVHTKQLG